MRKTLPAIMIAALLVAGCSGSGPATPQVQTGTGADNPLIPEENRLTLRRGPAEDLRSRLGRIDDLSADALPGGLILRVRATAAQQGAYSLGLREIGEGPDSEGVLRYELVGYMADPGRDGARVGAEASRRLIAATRIGRITLQGVSRIEVVGASNSLGLRP